MSCAGAATSAAGAPFGGKLALAGGILAALWLEGWVLFEVFGLRQDSLAASAGASATARPSSPPGRAAMRGRALHERRRSELARDHFDFARLAASTILTATRVTFSTLSPANWRATASIVRVPKSLGLRLYRLTTPRQRAAGALVADSRRSGTSQSVLARNASMYFGRCAGA